MPGFDTIPMVIMLTGVFQSTSTSSRVLKQAATPAKPQGSVGGLTSANALASRGDLGGDEALGALGGGLKGMVLVGRRTLLLARSAVVGWGLPLWLSLVRMGVIPCPTWCKLESPSRQSLYSGSGTKGISGSGGRS